MDQKLATFYYGERAVDVYGCWDEGTPEGRLSAGDFDFYDLYEMGVCLNLGNPLYVFPSWAEARYVEAN